MQTFLQMLCKGVKKSGYFLSVSFLTLFFAIQTYAKTVDVPITGTVKDAVGNPLAGASVRIKGTTIGTVTNEKGNYTLSLPKGDETLSFSFIGYVLKEVKVGGQKVINVSLDEDQSTIQEVVVVGYGEQKLKTSLAANTALNTKNVEDLPVGSLSAALSGQMLGVSVSGGTSRPGEAASITVRNPMLYSKDGGTLRPLYVIDGVIREEQDFNVLDISEVESMNVLKDAAAAIYGARGANGVVVVQTKRGKNGAPRFSYSSTYSITNGKLPKMMNGYELASYINDYNFAAGKKETDANSVIYTADELDYFKNNSQSWIEQAWKKSNVMRHTFNVSGGTDKGTYFAGVNYFNQDANFENINSDRWSFRASADINVSKNVKAGLGVAGDLSNKKNYWGKQGSENAERDFNSLVYVAPFKPAYVDGLPVNLTVGTGSTVENYHFFEVVKSGNYSKARNTGLNINAYVEYDVPFIKGLKARASYNKNFENNWGKQFGTKYKVYNFNMLGTNKHIYGGGVKTEALLNNGDRVRLNPDYSESYQLNGQLTYSRTFGRHEVSALAVVEQAENYSNGTSAMVEGLVTGALDNIGYGMGATTAGAGVGVVTETEAENGRLSYVGRLNYGFADKYLAEFTIRRDASTNFAPDNRWGTFPSMALGWVASEEQFIKDHLKFIDRLKFRFSVGLTGMDNTKAYNWLKSYNLIQTGNGPVFGGNAERAGIFRLKNAMPNLAISWDSDVKWNAGIDANFLNNRLSVTFEAFQDHRYDMLSNLTSSIPLNIGATLPSINFAEVKGFGTELMVGWKGKFAKDWTFNANLLTSWNDNRQIKVDYDKGLTGTYLDPSNKSTDMGLLGLQAVGMFRTQEEVDAWLKQYPNYTIYGTKPAPGMLYYQDVRGAKNTVANADGTYSYAEADGKIDDNDRIYLKNKKDNHYGFGMNFSTKYKGLSLSFVVGGSTGGQNLIESTARGWGTSAQAAAYTNLPFFLTDHWTPTNTNATYPAPYYRGQNQLDSDFWYVNSFTLSMRNINLSYEVPKTITNRLNVRSARVYMVVTNPVNLYNPYSYKAWPNAYDIYPNLRSTTFGLNLGL